MQHLGDAASNLELSVIKARDNEFAFKIFIDLLDAIEIQEMMVHVVKHLQKFDFFTLKRFACVSQNWIFASSDIFSSKAQLFVAIFNLTPII